MSPQRERELRKAQYAAAAGLAMKVSIPASA